MSHPPSDTSPCVCIGECGPGCEMECDHCWRTYLRSRLAEIDRTLADNDAVLKSGPWLFFGFLVLLVVGFVVAKVVAVLW